MSRVDKEELNKSYKEEFKLHEKTESSLNQTSIEISDKKSIDSSPSTKILKKQVIREIANILTPGTSPKIIRVKTKKSD